MIGLTIFLLLLLVTAAIQFIFSLYSLLSRKRFISNRIQELIELVEIRKRAGDNYHSTLNGFLGLVKVILVLKFIIIFLVIALLGFPIVPTSIGIIYLIILGIKQVNNLNTSVLFNNTPSFHFPRFLNLIFIISSFAFYITFIYSYILLLFPNLVNFF